VIAFDEVVAPLFVDMPDAVKMWVIAAIDLADDTSIGRSFICDDGDRAMEPYTLNSFVEKGLGRLGISPRSQAEVYHLTVCIDSPPQIASFAADTDVGLIDMPVDAGPAQMFLGSLGQFGAELLDPSIHGRLVDYYAELFQ